MSVSDLMSMLDDYKTEMPENTYIKIANKLKRKFDECSNDTRYDIETFRVITPHITNNEDVSFVHHYITDDNKWDGHEQGGLLPSNPNMRPDGYCANSEQIAKFLAIDPLKGTIYQYHGNHCHGYPPDHEKYNVYQSYTKKYNHEMYFDTVMKMNLYKRAGYNVLYIWAHECIMNENILDCVRVL